MTFPRPLTIDEKAIALRVLELGEVDELDTLRQQLDAATAATPCPCGCPSIFITVDPARAPRATQSGRPVAEAHYGTGAIMLFVDDGWVSNLEVYGTSGDAPSEWPPIDQLRALPPDH